MSPTTISEKLFGDAMKCSEKKTYKVESENVGVYNYKVFKKELSGFSEPVARTTTEKGAKILQKGLNKKFVEGDDD